MGGYKSSNSLVLKSNHEHGNRPKGMRVVEPNYGNMILTTNGPKRRSGEK